MFDKKSDTITIYIEQQIRGEALRALLDFCFSNSDTISLSQPHNIGMTKEEADQATSVYEEYLVKNGMYEGLRPSEEEMLKVYKEMAETEEELKEMLRKNKEAKERFEATYKKTQEEVTKYYQDIFKDYMLIDRDVTCMTPSTHGGPQVMYYLQVEEQIKKQFYIMEELFQPVIVDETTELRLDDPTFYKAGKIIFLVCSHEKFATLFLNEVQFADLKKLNIPYTTI